MSIAHVNEFELFRVAYVQIMVRRYSPFNHQASSDECLNGAEIIECRGATKGEEEAHGLYELRLKRGARAGPV